MNPITWLISLINRLLSLFTRKTSIYTLDHAILNLPVPPPTLWMNMGYWKNASDLPTACTALLTQLLIAARLLDPSGHAAPHPPRTRFHLLDVGIGCGDQSLALLRARRRTPHPDGATTHAEHTEEEEPLFDRYVGITDLPRQADMARERLPSASTDSAGRGPPHARIYAANAADPAAWPRELHSALQTAGADGDGDGDPQIQTWLLALDALYHFRPSRAPLLAHACGHLRASLMAFDLLRGDAASAWQRLLLWVVCWVAGTPGGNFVTRTEYEALLVRAGYALEKIEIRDVSADVFGGLAGFIRRRDAELRPYGLSVGRYRVAAKVFEWWARTGVVRGVVLVARV